MDSATLEKIRQAAEASIRTPGGTDAPLPKANPQPGDNYIVVFRHGESEDNLAKIFCGWRDPDITARGVEQAAMLAPKLAQLKLNLVITSDQKRSQQTARHALTGNPDIHFEIDPRVKERNYGDLNGQNKEEIMRRDPRMAALWRRSYDVAPPGGESLIDVENRVRPFLDELVARIRREKINVAISTHGNTMRALRNYFEHMTVEELTTHENPLGTDYALYVVPPEPVAH